MLSFQETQSLIDNPLGKALRCNPCHLGLGDGIVGAFSQVGAPRIEGSFKMRDPSGLAAEGDEQLGLLAARRDAVVRQQVHVRWDVKTGGGAGADLIDPAKVESTTISALISAAAPASWPPPSRVKPYETTVWQLDATLVAYKPETDGDYHLVISDTSNHTMVVEIPDPAAVDSSSLFVTQIKAARTAFDARFGQQIAALRAIAQPADISAPMIAHVSVPVRVTGIGFFDFAHGATGAAPNSIELHPVLSIQF